MWLLWLEIPDSKWHFIAELIGYCDRYCDYLALVPSYQISTLITDYETLLGFYHKLILLDVTDMIINLNDMSVVLYFSSLCSIVSCILLVRLLLIPAPVPSTQMGVRSFVLSIMYHVASCRSSPIIRSLARSPLDRCTDIWRADENVTEKISEGQGMQIIKYEQPREIHDSGSFRVKKSGCWMFRFELDASQLK